MVGARLIATAASCCVLVTALVAHSQDSSKDAGVKLGDSLELPTTWQPIDELVLEAPKRSRGIVFGGRRGFGDPAAGVFLILQEVSFEHPELAPGALHPALAEALELPTNSVSNLTVINYAARSLSRVDFSLGKTRGAVHTIVMRQGEAGLRARSAACFYNQREAQRSKTQCEQVLAQFEEMP